MAVTAYVIKEKVVSKRAEKRKKTFSSLAKELGLGFKSRDKTIDDRFGFLDALRQRTDRYAKNIISGKYQGYEVMVFDYHCTERSRPLDIEENLREYHFSFFILMLENSYPEVTIERKGFGAKIMGALGFDNFKFESQEFSEVFGVRSKDKKLAYEVCNAEMMEYLLKNSNLSIEIERNVLALKFDTRLRTCK